ncbi:MAG TPA: hypothetical protein VIX61_06060, partial [Casimicrobiaceae bacterium]
KAFVDDDELGVAGVGCAVHGKLQDDDRRPRLRAPVVDHVGERFVETLVEAEDLVGRDTLA